MQHEGAFAIGAVLDGRYQLDRPLGEGGMGTIWVGRQLALGREVAIKSIKPGRFQDHAQLAREARLLASVHHPAIVQVYDFSQVTGQVAYVVMELVRGESLESHLDRRGRIPAVEAVSLLLPLLDGLAVVHAAGIIHRDIKPANVVLALEGVSGSTRVMPKLLDFGIARDAVPTALTVQGDLAGTPDYMAPEQFLGARADARSDLWSVAAMLYDMLAGEPPFAGANLFEIMRRVRDEPPPFPRAAEGLDGALWRSLTRTLRKDPSERPESALALRAELAAWLTAHGGPRDFAMPSPPRSALSTPADETASKAAAAQRTTLLAESPSPTLDALIKQRLGGS